MSHGDLQGWSADPFQLHEQRYFSAGQPTKLVRNGGVESYDEPPSVTFDRGAAAAAAVADTSPAGVQPGARPASSSCRPAPRPASSPRRPRQPRRARGAGRASA